MTQLVLIMGVSGSGKTTVARLLADRWNARFIDADDFHSLADKQQMASGVALNDEQRLPWLSRIIAFLNSEQVRSRRVVLAYSGLKRAHRSLFFQTPFSTHGIMLAVTKAQVAARLESRSDHFFDKRLLDSQFVAMEPVASSESIQTVDASNTPESIANTIYQTIVE